MKDLSKLLISCLVLFYGCQYNGCEGPEGPTSVTGKLFNDHTGKPIAGAVVSVLESDRFCVDMCLHDIPFVSDTTDSLGQFSINFTAEKRSRYDIALHPQNTLNNCYITRKQIEIKSAAKNTENLSALPAGFIQFAIDSTVLTDSNTVELTVAKSAALDTPIFYYSYYTFSDNYYSNIFKGETNIAHTVKYRIKGTHTNKTESKTFNLTACDTVVLTVK